MAKALPMDVRIKTPVTSMVPLRVRQQMEDLARRRNVSLSEIGREALQEYVEKEGA